MLSVVCRHTFVIHTQRYPSRVAPQRTACTHRHRMLRHSFAPTPCTSGKLADTERIERSLMVLETIVLPLNYVSILAGTLGVEPRHTESKSVALPLRYAPTSVHYSAYSRGTSHVFATDAHGCRVSPLVIWYYYNIIIVKSSVMRGVLSVVLQLSLFHPQFLFQV